jgi:hypothetical protein
MKFILTAWIALVFSSIIPENLGKIFISNISNSDLSNPIIVRESTVDLQVRVGEKLYVFGKSQGTLDMVKVGMHLFSFAQNPKIEGIKADFAHVSWKKLKDGSIQIQSSYKPWPSQLTWLVLPDGRLKMEATSPEISGGPLDNMGVGFDFPEDELKSMVLNNQDLKLSTEGFTSSNFKTINFEFDYVKLNILSEINELAFNAYFKGEKSNQSDLVILFPATNPLPGETSSPGPASSESINRKPTGQNSSKMILWFDFQ